MAATLLTYSFNPEVWGTISDWVMVGVTALTAFLLIITLYSQKEVQKTQSELFKIESIRFKESIKPILKYSASTNMFRNDSKDEKVLTVEVTNDSNSIALKISQIVSQRGQTTQILIPMGLADKRDHLVKGDPPLLYHFLINPNLPVSDWVIFALDYQDVAGTKYKQSVICIYDMHGIEINCSLPEIISAKDVIKST